jgi:hypothetical protein
MAAVPANLDQTAGIERTRADGTKKYWQCASLLEETREAGKLAAFRTLDENPLHPPEQANFPVAKRISGSLDKKIALTLVPARQNDKCSHG